MRFILLLTFAILYAHAVSEEREQKDLKNNKDYLELIKKEKEIQTFKGIKNDVDKNFNDLKNIQISYAVRNISISNASIIEFDLHPKHFTKIYFPPGTSITGVNSSTPLKDKTFLGNRVILRPNNSLLQSSISISFLYEKKLYDITIIANKYDVSNSRNGIDNVFYPKTNFVIEEILSPEEVLETYRKTHNNKYPSQMLSNFRIGYSTYSIEKETPFNKIIYPSTIVSYRGVKTKYKISLGEL